MVSNPFKEQRECYKWMDKRFNNLASGGLDENLFYIDVLSVFAVSEASVKRHLKRFINANIIMLKDGCLFKVYGGKK